MKKRYFNLKSILGILLIYFCNSLAYSQVTVTLGSGTNVHGTTTAGPINQFYRSLHCQIVYTAAELNAVGITGGTLTKLGFYIASGVTNPLPNYTVKLKHTAANNVAVYDGTGLITVYNTPSYNPPAGGFDMLTLSTPFLWNGTDNILVDVCFDQVSAYTSTGVVRIYSPTVPSGFIFVRSDSSPQCGVACSSTSSNKPQIQFEFLPPAPLDLGVSSFLKPLTTKTCFANDTIVVALKNYGSAVADFSVTPAIITVKTTGPNPGTYTVAVNGGTLASNATQDFTLTTNYNLSNIGTYKLKGYATVVGDGSVINDTTQRTITRNPVFSTSILPNDSVCLGVPVQLNANFSSTKQVGTGTLSNSSTSYPSPYGNFYKGARHQFLFLASELTAAGLVAGNVTSISFNATNLNTAGAFINHNIALATTTVTSLPAFQTTGFTTYFSSPSYTPVLGINTHTFSTPFVWDGVSNIIIETCFNNNPLAYTQNVSVLQSTTPFTSSVWYNSDVDATLCSSSSSSSSMSQRPNVAFGQPSTITYSWSAPAGLSATNIANPIANVGATTTFTVEGTIGNCMTYDTVRIFIKPTPTPNLGPDSLYCSLPVILNANTSANSFLWNNGSIASSLNVTTPGKYWIRATNSNGCINSDTALVSLGTSPIVTLGSDTAFCQGSTINLYAGAGSGNSYLWNTGATSPSISVGTAGTYSVTVTNTIGCKSSDLITVTSKPKPSVSLVFSSAKTFCESDNVNRALTEGTPANGTYIGAGVTTTTLGSYFNPTTATQGSHIILYNYVGPNGCSNVAKDTLVVNACVAIEEFTSDIGIRIFPNPTSGIFTLEINSSENLHAHINVMTIEGRIVTAEVMTGSGLLSKNVNLEELADGIYYLKIETKEGSKTYKVIKQ
jgi:hypothetical protein